jgi:hypothetical protein
MKKYEINGACSMCGWEKWYLRILVENLRERDNLEELGID